MDTFAILVEGYARRGNDDAHMFASPSSVLIESLEKKVLVDPGADRRALLDGLNKLDLKLEDIDIVFLTHWHPDHFLNIRLFPEHIIMDASTIWKDTGEEVFPETGEICYEKIPGTEIEIFPTPGHREEHASLLIETADLGTVCIAQDVIWWMDGEQPGDLTEEDILMADDPYRADQSLLIESRKKVLEVSDWIIPGHGKMFRNPKRK